MNTVVEHHIASCKRCLHYRGRQDVALLVNVSSSQSLVFIHLAYLHLEPSKGNFGSVLVITDHFSWYA